jgi:hypothetical protein
LYCVMLHSICQQAAPLHVRIYNGVKQLLQFYYMICTLPLQEEESVKCKWILLFSLMSRTTLILTAHNWNTDGLTTLTTMPVHLHLIQMCFQNKLNTMCAKYNHIWYKDIYIFVHADTTHCQSECHEISLKIRSL